VDSAIKSQDDKQLCKSQGIWSWTIRLKDKDCSAKGSYMNFDVKIEISSGPEILPCFYSIFQRGFLFLCRVGTSIEDLLLHQLSLDPKLVEEKVNTVFLDGCCVDDISSAILNKGSIIAFSSALPGLAGATLRRGGHYARLRESITHRQQIKPETQEEGLIIVKLFNLLMAEMGGIFLEKGIVLDQKAAADLFNPEQKQLWRIKTIEVNGVPSSCETLLQNNPFADSDLVMIRAVKDGKPADDI
jgi:hypothetical protein